MITQKTSYQIKAEELTKLIDVLTPIAYKYKAPSKAKDALKACEWWISQGNNTKFCKHIVTNGNREFFEVSAYSKLSTLTEMLLMLKDQLERYQQPIEITCYKRGLDQFLNDNLGKDIELTQDQFNEKKRVTIEAMRNAIKYVEQLTDCNDFRYVEYNVGE